MKRLIAFLIALLPVSMLTPVAAQADLSCGNGFCTQTFFYTGSSQTFEIPDSVEELNFEVFGASGSRGGPGGIISGTLKNLPEVLTIEVGQAGSFGSNRPGGYNGGGASGANKANEGSGGGASDIRLGTSLESRIVVAGGGGGGGGGAGGSGGFGGGLIAADGPAGQASGGGGGSQTSGGFAGANSGNGNASTAGRLGIGGNGGSGSAAGGGGGGGGYFGGGGGGGDDFSGGFDGGAGGGGSSFASIEFTESVAHQSGVHWGHGRVVLSYQVPPQVLMFSAEQLNQSQLEFEITLNQTIQGLESEDFELLPSGCRIERTLLNDNVVELLVDGCPDGPVTLTLKANSIGSIGVGPALAVSRTVVLDQTGPVLTFSPELAVSSASNFVASYQISDQIQLSTSDFAAVGCDLQVDGTNVQLTNCSEGRHELRVKANSFQDSWGNPGPVSDVVWGFEVDNTPPTATWSEITVTGSGPFTYSVELNLTEIANLYPGAVSFSSSAQCETGNLNHTYWATCDHAELFWTLDHSLIQDWAGNRGFGETLVSISHLAPIAPVQPEAPRDSVSPEQSAPVPAVAEPEPTQAEPTANEPAVAEPAATEPEITQSPEAEPPSSEPTESSEPPTSTESELIFLIPVIEGTGSVLELVQELATQVSPSGVFLQDESQISTEPVDLQPVISVEGQVDDTAVTLPEPELQLAAGPILSEQESSAPWLLFGFAVLAAILLGIGAWRFSGR